MKKEIKGVKANDRLPHSSTLTHVIDNKYVEKSNASFEICLPSYIGSSLGPVHKSVGPVKIITRLQKLNMCQDLMSTLNPILSKKTKKNVELRQKKKKKGRMVHVGPNS